ncbi:MAG: hypothetical protein GXP31_07245 [Kiritimatiellaeota bacterium]|nr:hypothetical protein [Kiritimatiellota bacterium]
MRFSIQHSACNILVALCWGLASPAVSAIGPLKGLEFDGAYKGISVASSATVKPTTALTVELWAYRATWSPGTYTKTMISCTETGGYNLTLDTTGGIAGNVYLTAVGNTRVYFPDAATNLAMGWHHFALTCDGRYTKLYIDGVLRDTDDAGAGHALQYHPTNSLQIGAEAGSGTSWTGDYFDGKLDEIRIWTVARTALEIRENMHLSLSGTESELGAYWRCDTGTGTVLLDSTSNVNTGMFDSGAGAPSWIDSTIPLATGTSFTHTVDTAGAVTFNGTDCGLNFTTKTGSTAFTVTQLQNAPHAPPGGPSLGTEYWVIQAHDGGTFTADLTLSGQEEVTYEDAQDPSRIKLWRRDEPDDGAWTLVTAAASADAGTDTVTFQGLTDPGQFVLTHSPPSALDFDGNDDLVDCGGDSSLALTGAMSITAWVKPSEKTSISTVVGRKVSGSTGAGFAFYLNSWSSTDRRLVMETENASFKTANAAVTWGVWQHIAFVSDGTTHAFYVNGVEQPATGSVNPTDAGLNLAIGAFSNLGGGPYKGLIDEVTIWNRALTVQELREQMHVNLAGNETGLVGYWSFDYGVGGTQAIDMSGTGNDGALTNMDAATAWVGSTAPIADGDSHTETVSAIGAVTFTGTDISMDFTAKSGATTFVVSHLLTAPNLRPTGARLDDEYWLVHAYDGGTYSANVTFGGQERLTVEDDADPTGLILHRRDSSSDGEWTQLAVGSAADSAADTVTFNGLTGFSQLMLMRIPPDDFAGVCLDFDNTDDYIAADSVSAAVAGSGTLTMEAWVYPRGGDDAILAFNTASNGNTLLLMYNTQDKFRVYDGTDHFSTDTFAPSHWYHVAVVIEANDRAVLYVNGEQQAVFVTSQRPSTDGKFSIGQEWDGGGPSNFFNGRIDEVAVWSVARTVEQIRESMNQGLTGAEPGLIGYWQFNDGAGSSTLADRSGNGHTGTLVNMDPATDWVTSTVAIGTSHSEDVSVPGQVAFPGTDITLDFSMVAGLTTIVVTRVPTAPDTTPPGNGIDDEYWTIRVYGAGTFTCDVIVGGQDQLSLADEDAPWGVKLRHRGAGSDGAWRPFSTAKAVDAAGEIAIFKDVADTALAGQFTLTRDATRTALEFDGVDDSLDCGNGASLRVTGNAITVEAWIKAETWKPNVWEGNVVAKDGDNSSGYMLRCGANGRADFSFGDGTVWHSATTGEVMDAGTWHHLAGVYDGSNLKVYIDGVEQASVAAVASIADTTNSLRIGDSPAYPTRAFEGTIDEMRIWSVARTAEEIRESMHLVLAGDEPGLRGYWRFDEGSGATAADATANRNDATLTNMDPAGAWTEAVAEVGPGVSETMTVAAAGAVDFDTVGLSFGVSSVTDSCDVVVTHLYTAPTIMPTGTPVDDESWIVRRYGDGTFTADLTVRNQWRLTAMDAADLSRVKLRRRNPTPDAPWSPLAPAVAVDPSAGYAAFKGVSDFGQLAVVHDAPGRALSFDGVASYATADAVCAAVAGGPLTVEAWVRPDAAATGSKRTICSFHTAAKGNLIIIGFNADEGRFYYFDDGNQWLTSTDTFPAGEWRHVAVTIDESNNVRLFVDGTPQISGYTTLKRPAADGLFSIGQEWDTGGASDFFQGMIDEVAVWSVARTQDEIRATMHLSMSGREPGLAGYWRFDDGVGPTATDAAVGGHDAILVGAPVWAPTTPAVAFGTSAVQTVDAPGAVDFSGTDLGLDFTRKTGATTYVVSCLQAVPNVVPKGFGDSDRYWVIDDYDGGTFAADLTVTAPGRVTAADKARPWRNQLHRRDSGSDREWALESFAATADTAGQTLTFAGLTRLSQFAVSQFEPDRVPGTALDFDGDDDSVEVQPAPDLTPTVEMTAEAWVYVTDNWVNQKVVGKTDDSARAGFVLWIYNYKLHATVWDALGTQYTFEGGKVPEYKWTHIAMTWTTSGRMIGYVNGVEVANIEASMVAIGATIDPLRIGIAPWDGTSNPLEGALDEVRLWTVARTAQEIRETMHVTLTGFETGLAGYWQFNDGSGTTAADTSGNGHAGTLKNMDPATDWVDSSVPVSAGSSNTQIVTGTGTVTFADTGLSMNVTAKNGATTFVVSHLEAAPNQRPAGTALADEYWVLHAYDGGTFTTDLTVGGQDLLTGDDQTTPARVRLHYRDATADGDWGALALGENVDANADTATFRRVGDTGQLVLTHDPVRIGPDTALDFDGANDYVACGTGIDLNTTSFTIEFWAQRKSTGEWNFVAGTGNGTNYGELQIAFQPDNRFTFAFYGDDFDTAAAYTDGDWHHWACVYDTSTNTRSIYRDGVLIGRNTAAEDLQIAAGEPFYIARRGGADQGWFPGSLDEMRVWSTARTATEIREHMYHPLLGNEAGLMAYWRFDDGAGTTLTDATGNGHNGTLTNMDPATDWIDSTAPISSGISSTRLTHIVDATTGPLPIRFPGTDFSMVLTSDTVGDTPVVVSRLLGAPNADPAGTPLDDEYWLVRAYDVAGGGPSPDFEAVSRFHTRDQLTDDDTAIPERVRLYHRNQSSDGNWSWQTWASEVDGDTAVFPGMNDSDEGQFVLTHDALSPGNALDFDGADDYVAANGVSAGVAGGPLTLEAWVRPAAGGGGNDTVMAFNTAAGGNVLLLAYKPADARFYYYDDSTGVVFSTDTFVAGRWYHMAVTIDGSDNATLYVDGTIQATFTATVRPAADALFSVGQEFDGGNTSDHFYGSIDEVAVWSVVRTPAEIRASMNQELTGNEAGLSAYYQFNQGVAGSDNAGVTTLIDRVTNGNDGTLKNFALTGDTSNWVDSYALVRPAAHMHPPTNHGGFTATWSTPTYGPAPTSYRLDVATDPGFASLVAGYDGHDVGNTTRYAVTGLDDYTTYYYRVHAYDSTLGEGQSSETIPVTPAPRTARWCLHLDGVDDYVEIDRENHGNGGVDLTDFTISLWFKKTGAGQTATSGNGGVTAVPLVTKGRDEGEGDITDVNYFLGIDTSGKLVGDFEDTATGANHPITGTTTIQNDTWYHAALTYDTAADTLRIYLNGAQDAEVATGNVTPRSDSIQNVAIGSALDSSGTPAGFFEGDIAEVCIWSSALTATDFATEYPYDMQRWYNNPRSTFKLKRYLRLDDGYGDRVSDYRHSIWPWIRGDAVWRQTDLDVLPAGPRRWAVEFNGASSYYLIDSPYKRGADLSSYPSYGIYKSFTVECWVRRDTADTDDCVFDEGDGSDGGGFASDGYADEVRIGFLADNSFQFGFYYDGEDDDILIAPGPYSDADWHHWAVTFDAQDMTRRIYRDGEIVAQDRARSYYYYGDDQIIGDYMYAANGQLDGAIDELRVWTTARSQQQLRENDYRTLQGDEDRLAGYLRFDEWMGWDGREYDHFVETVSGDMQGYGNKLLLTEGVIPFAPVAPREQGLEFGHNFDDGWMDQRSVARLGPQFDLAEKSLTIEFWAQRYDTQSTEEAVLFFHGAKWDAYFMAGFKSAANGNALFLEYRYDPPGAGNSVAEAIALPAYLTDGRWHHWAIVVADGSETGENARLRVFRDGDRVYEKTLGFEHYEIFGEMNVGNTCDVGYDSFVRIDEFRIWSLARTGDEIASAMSRELNSDEPRLEGYYKFNEGAGFNLFDSSVHNRHGRLYHMSDRYRVDHAFPGGFSYLPDTNQALSAPDRLSVAGSELFDDTGDFTWEAWIKPVASGGWQNIISRYDHVDGWTGGAYSFMVDENEDLQFLKNGQAVIPPAGEEIPVTLDQWQHVAVRVEADTNGSNDTVTLFVNGHPQYSTDAIDVGASLPAHLYTGIGSTFRGRLDEISVWSVARTDQQILNSFKRRRNGTETGLEAYFDFNDAGDPVAADRARNSHRAWLSNDTVHTLDRRDVPDLLPALPGEWAAAFDGVDDYATIPGDPAFDSNEFSVEFWVKQSETGLLDAMLDKGAPDTDFYFATQNGTPITPEPDGRCVNVTSGYLDLAAVPAIFNGPGGTISDFTVELWVKPYQVDDYEGTLFEITRATGGEGNFVRLMQRNNWRYVYLIVGDDATGGDWSTRDRVGVRNGFCQQADTWYHIAATFAAGAPAGERLKLYVNGIRQTAYAGSYGPSTAGKATFFAQTSHNQYSKLKAQVDEIRIWNVARTQAEIVDNMHKDLTVPQVGLLHYYKLDENVDPTANPPDPLADTALDTAIPGGNPGTFSGTKQRLISAAPIGTAVTDTRVEAAGVVAFPAAGLSLDYSEQDGATVTAVKITSDPSAFPTGCQPFDEQYWIVHRDCTDDTYWFPVTLGTPYLADFTFSLAEDLTAGDALNPDLIALYRRNHTSDGQWDLVGTAAAVDADNDTVTFADVPLVYPGQAGTELVTQSSQFLVGRRVGQGVVFGIGQGPGLGSRELSFIWGDDAWHHVCGTYDGTTMKLYADGSLVGTAAVAAEMTTNGIRVGSYRDGTGFFGGMLDELRYWSRPLSAADVGFYHDKELRGNELGLEGYWKFREGSGTVAGDSAGHGHDAQLHNGLAREQHDNAYVSLPVGDYALSLDSDTLVYVGGLAGLTATLSIEAWVRKTEATTNPTVFSIGNGALAVYAGHNGSECMAYYDSANGWIESSALVPVGEWHHLAWTLQKEVGTNGYINFYLDGELVDQTPLTADLPDLAGDSFIGRTDVGVDPLLGEVSDVRIWNVVRSVGDIGTYMEKRLGGNEAGLVAYWPCTEGSGQLIADLSPNGYDAVFYYAYDLNWVQPEGLVFEKAPPEPKALLFDAGVTSVNLPYRTRPAAFTVAAWVKPDATHADDAEDDVIVGWGGATGHFAELRITTENKLLYCEFDGDWQPLVAPNLIPTGQWTHVAATKSGTTVTLFINGRAQASGMIDQDLELDSLAIGSAAGDPDLRPFFGLIDEVQFWDVALTDIGMDELWGDEDHLIRYYKFDEGGGANAIDYTGSGFYNGRLTVGLDADHRVSQDDLPMTRLGERQNAFEFDGIDDYLDVTHFDRPDPMMLSAWIKPGAVNPIHTIICWSDRAAPETGHRIAFRLDNGHLEYGENSGSWTAVTGASTIPQDTWTHVAVVKDGANVTLYVNGAQDGTGTIAGTPATDRLTVGMQPGEPTAKHFYKGLIEELQVWDSAPTAAEIANLRYNTRRGNETGLVFYYNFNQPSGLTIEDQTANGYTGDMKNIEFSNLHRIEIPDTELALDYPPRGEYVLHLDGVDDYLSVDGLAPTAYTVSVWFKPAATAPAEDITLLAGPNFGLVLHPDNSVTHWWNTADGIGTQTLDAVTVRGQWQCLVAVNDGLTARLYHGRTGVANFAADVTSVATFTGGRQNSDAGTVYFGDNPNDADDAPFEGYVDELAIWETALPEKDIAALWEHELQGSEDGLLAFYNFNGGDPTAAADTAGDAQDAVLHNMVLKSREDREPGFVLSSDGVVRDGTWDAAADAPEALQFDAFDDYAVIPRAALIMADASFTFEFWLRADPWTGQQPLVTNALSSSTDSAWGFFLDADEQRWNFKLFGDLTLVGGRVDDRAWHHLCVVYDAPAGYLHLYQDGLQVAAGVPLDIAAADNGNDIVVGSDVDRSVLFGGFVDEIRRWNVALTPDRISARFNHYMRASRAELDGYWRIHDVSAVEVADLSGGHPMALHNMLASNVVVGADFAPPAPGELAVELDGADDFIRVDNTAGRLGLQAFTISLWFKKTGAGAPAQTGGLTAVPLVAKGREEGDGSIHDINYFLGIDETGALAADFEDMAGGANYPLKGSTAIQDGVWYHAAVTYDPNDSGQGFKLYLNGVAEGSRSTGGAVPRHDSDQAVAIGSALNSSGFRAGNFAGLIDEVRIWSVALSRQELQAGMNNHRRGGETGLTALWQCDSGWGATLVDAGRRGIDGTLINMDTDNCWGGGRVLDPPQDGDHAIAFGTGGQHVEIDAAREDDFDFPGNFTIEFWLKVEAWNETSQAIVSKGDSGWQVRRYLDTQKIAFSTPGIQKDTDDDGVMDDAPDLVSSSDIPTGEWTHIAVVYNADMHRKHLYVNGNLDASVYDVSGFVQTNAFPVWVGANAEVPGLVLNGAVDELRIWTTARSAARVHANYNRNVRDNEKGLLGRWRFNEGHGNTALDSKKGDAINATLVNLGDRDRIDGVELEEWTNVQYALLLDGTDEDVAVDPLTADLTGGFSMEAWIRPDVLADEDGADTRQHVFDLATADGQSSVALLLDGDDLRFEVVSGGSVTGSLVAESVFTPEVWAHIAVTVDSQGVVRLFVDGEERAVSGDGDEVALPTNTSWDGVTFGSNGGRDEYFTGAVDEFRLWDHVRAGADIKLFHDRELFAGTTGLFGYWKLNEGLGVAVFDQTDADTAGTARNIEEDEDWVDGKHIVADATNRQDFNLTKVPSAAGLWKGQITLDRVSEVSSISLETRPTKDEMVIDIILHVDATGQVRLLKDVTLMRTATDDNDEAHVVLVTDESRLGDFVGLVNRDGVLIGLRKSTVFYDFDGNDLPMDGGLGFGHVAYGLITIAADAPTNPYRHKYHPDHRVGYRIDRSFFMVFDAGPTSGPDVAPGQGVDRLTGTYQETFYGLHKRPIRMEGDFTLQRISRVDVLNNGE